MNDAGHTGAQAEITEAWKNTALEQMTGYRPQVKGRGELTSKGGKLGVQGELRGEHVTFGLEFRLIGSDFEKGTVDFLQLIFKITKPQKLPPLYVHSMESQATVEVTENWEFTFKPDYKMFARWIGEQFLRVAGSELAVGLGFVGNGLVAIIVPLWYASLGSEISTKVTSAMTMLDNATNAYQNTITGRTVSGAGGAGYADGARLAEQVLRRAEENVPRQILMGEARKRNLKREAWGAAWPGIRQGFIDAYKSEHYVEQFFYDDDDAPGLKSLIRLLDAAATAPGRGG